MDDAPLRAAIGGRGKVIAAIAALGRSGLLAPRSLLHLGGALACEGAGLAALARFAAGRYGNAIAIVEDGNAVSYRELWRRSGVIAAALSAQGDVAAGDAIGLSCRNSVAGVVALFAAARLRLATCLVNPDMLVGPLAAMALRERIAVFVLDDGPALDQAGWRTAPLGDGPLRLARTDQRADRRKRGRAEIVVMTGGTTGEPRPARRRPSFAAFLPLFAELVARVGLDRRRSVFIATPIHHGFGLAALLIAVTLGKTIHLMPRFDAATACALIARARIDAITVVPTMLRRILAWPDADLSALRCIVSGGAPLDRALVTRALDRAGDCLFNLYGTSEAGFCVIATPRDLRAAPTTIGRPISGAAIDLIATDGGAVGAGETGQIRVRSRVGIRTGGWIETGDLAWRDDRGYLFLRGRIDDMIVSGGENVYPIELEAILLDHGGIEQTSVIGVADEDFGQRLRAFVVPASGCGLDEAALRQWLEPRTAPHQRPATIRFVRDLPLTGAGKIDTAALAARVA